MITFPAHAKKIIQLKEDDLALRNQLIEQGLLHNGYNKAMAELHNHNAEALEAIMDEIGGYPTIHKVGEEGNAAAWLVIQHSIGLPEFMRKCAQLLKDAVADKQASPLHLAYLEDRIAIFEGRPQLYGTQYDWDEHGQLSPQYITDAAAVNQRRQAIGLDTLEERTATMRARAISEKESPPADYAKRQKEMNAWRKSVGW